MQSTPSRRRPVRFARPMALGLALLAATSAAAQPPQPNTAAARLSINAVGAIAAPNAAPTYGSIPVNSSGTPATPATAPLLVADVMARSALELRVQGSAPLLPVVVAAGTPSGTQIPLPGGMFELNPFSFVYFINGLDPSNLVNATAFLGTGSRWSLVLPQGLPPGAPSFHFQAAVVDPGIASGYTITSSITLRTRNDVDTLVRNTADAYVLAPQNPLLLSSLLANGFRWDGFDATAWVADAIASMAGTPLSPLPIVYAGAGANAPGAPAPAAGAPAPGQSSTFYGAFREVEPGDCAAPSGRGSQERVHDLRAVEELGVWRLAGNQHAFFAGVEIELRENPGGAAPGYTANLHFEVEDELGQNGGIASVDVSGPQLAAINGSGAATSTAPGLTNLFYCCSSGIGSEWSRDVTVGILGSRLPFVEGGPSAVDTYVFTVTWSNPGTPASTVTVPLRCAVVPETDPTGAAVRVAIPGNGATPPSAALASAGTANASLSLTFPVTALAATLHSCYAVQVSQGALYFEFDDLVLTPSSGQITVSFCAPSLAAGQSTTIELEQSDVFNTSFVASWTVTL